MLARVLDWILVHAFKVTLNFSLTLGFTIYHTFYKEKLSCANPAYQIQSIIIICYHLLKSQSLNLHDKYHSISIKVPRMKRDETECSIQIQLMKSVLQSSCCIPVVKAFENYM